MRMVVMLLMLLVMGVLGHHMRPLILLGHRMRLLALRVAHRGAVRVGLVIVILVCKVRIRTLTCRGISIESICAANILREGVRVLGIVWKAVHRGRSCWTFAKNSFLAIAVTVTL